MRSRLKTGTQYTCRSQRGDIICSSFRRVIRFLSLLYGGSDIFSDNTETDQTINQDLSYEKETSLMKGVMSVCQDIVYGVSKRKT